VTGRLAGALGAAPPRVIPAAPVAPAPPLVVALRDYQEDFVHKVRLEYRAGSRAILLVAATGAGKTVVFSYIAKSAAAKGSRVLILAHRDQLIKQASRKLNDNGVQHGIIMAGFTPNPRRLVQVASVQTIVRRLDKMKAADADFDLIVIDEAHLSAAASYMKVLAAWPKARVLGVTGSPIRLDGKGLGRHAGGSFDKIVQGISIRELIEQGYLVRPVVYASKTQVDLSAIKKIGGDYDNAELAKVMDKPVITGSAIEHYKRICPGVPAVAWCANVAHAKHVAAQFNEAGIPALALSGEDDSMERDRALAALSDGSLKIITFAMLLVEGVDCPAIGAIILLRPTMSLSSYLQTIGRGLRPIYADGMPLGSTEARMAAIDAGPKGRRCFVLDHAGLVFRHGLADEDREWSLEGAVKKKGKKKDEDRPPPVSQCPKCFVVHVPSETCPACGHVYEVKVRKLNEVDGELTEITADDAARIRSDRQREVGRAQTLEELEKIAAERGYSRGWAKHLFLARQRKMPAPGAPAQSAPNHTQPPIF
jgi:DNA repair protein RadD